MNNITTTNTTNTTTGINREDYERELKRKQEEHLQSINNQQAWQPCMHDQCPECLGTGMRKSGGSCIHGIACPCPKCSFRC